MPVYDVLMQHECFPYNEKKILCTFLCDSKVQVGNDQEIARSEINSHSKNRNGKN